MSLFQIKQAVTNKQILFYYNLEIDEGLVDEVNDVNLTIDQRFEK